MDIFLGARMRDIVSGSFFVVNHSWLLVFLAREVVCVEELKGCLEFFIYCCGAAVLACTRRRG